VATPGGEEANIKWGVDIDTTGRKKGGGESQKCPKSGGEIKKEQVTTGRVKKIRTC